MARERLFFDGWELTDGVARDWETFTGLDGVGQIVGLNTRVTGHPGEMWTPKQTGPGSFTVAMWLSGANRHEALEAWRQVIRAVYRPHRQVLIRRVMPSGEPVTARAEISGVIEPVFLGEQGVRASLTFAVASGTFESEAEYEHASAAGQALPVTLPLGQLEPSTAGMDRLSFTIHGPIVNPQVTDVTDGVDGEWFRYIGALTAGQFLTVNCKTYELVGGGGHAANPNALNYVGARFIHVPAARPGDVPRVRLTGSGAGALTRLQVHGHRAYAT